MHRRLLPALLILPLLCATGRADPARQQWQAINNTAASITGDITVTPDRITFAGGHALTLSQPTALSRFRVEGSPIAATRYRVASPADPILLNGNRLCGGRTLAPVTYIVLWTPRKLAGDTAPRSLAAFSGTTPPTGTDSPGLCGTFRYEASPVPR